MIRKIEGRAKEGEGKEDVNLKKTDYYLELFTMLRLSSRTYISYVLFLTVD